jgi:tRNA dimethylallyltransferase
MERPTVLVLAGPTAAGKTEAALAAAEAVGGVVLSADAMQVYKYLDIGTAKATAAQRARVPHFGIDLVEPDAAFDANDFVDLATAVIGQGRPVVVAGGTSLYLRSLLRGLVPTPRVDPALRARLEALPDPHAALVEVDPPLAARLHPNDRVRIVRGLEVFHALGERLSDLQAAHAAEPDQVRAVGLWLDRDDLRTRIAARLTAMMEAGYVREVRGLLDQGYDRTLKPMRSLGYAHLAAHLLDGVPLEEAVRRAERDTWQLARKQRNWMRLLGFERVERDHVERAVRAAHAAFGT